MATTIYHAEGIVCDGCVKAITNALAKVPGVTTIEVAIPEQRVTVQHEDQTSRDEMQSTLIKAGYTARSIG